MSDVPDDLPIAVDVETLGREGGRRSLPLPWQSGDSLFCVGFAVRLPSGARRFAFPADPEHRAEIARWLRRPNPKVFHNSSYDLTWLRACGFDVSGPVHDTAWAIALGNGAAARGLKPAGAYEYAIHLPKDNALRPDLVLAYCGNDCLNTLSLFTPEAAPFRHQLYRLYQRLALPLATLSLQGMPLFSDRLQSLIATTEADLSSLDARLRAIAPINWCSSREVVRALGDTLPDIRTPRGRQSTADLALRQCRHAAAPILLAYRAAATLFRTFLRHYRGLDCVRGLFNLNSAWTGRTSVRQMSLQNIPKPIRTLFGRSGWEWIKLDVAGIDLLVAAVVTGCRSLLELLQAGRDLHRETAARMAGISEHAVSDDLRQGAKCAVFATLYGGGPGAACKRARKSGLALPLEDAAALQRALLQAHPELADYQRETAAHLANGDAISSPFGRRWQLLGDSYHERNQALAAPIAATSSDLVLLGLDAILPRITAIGGILVNAVHDELDVIVPTDDFDPAAWREIARTMETIDARFPLRIEIGVGPDWGSTTPLSHEGG